MAAACLAQSAHEQMLASLDLVGESGVDIVPLFFARFYAKWPDERERFCNRTSSEGLMVNEMLAMLLAFAAEEPWLRTMMRAQVNTHHDHGNIALEQYAEVFAMLVDVLRDAAGSEWSPELDAVWGEAATGLFGIIAEHY